MMKSERQPASNASGLKAMVMRLWSQHRNLILYAFIGGSAVMVDLGLFTLLHEVFGWSAIASNSVSVPVSVVWSFTLNATLNFKTTDVILARLASFAVVSGIGFVASLLIIWGVEGIGQPGLVAKLVSLPVVFLLQYFLNSRLTFRDQSLKGASVATDSSKDAVELGVCK